MILWEGEERGDDKIWNFFASFIYFHMLLTTWWMFLCVTTSSAMVESVHAVSMISGETGSVDADDAIVTTLVIQASREDLMRMMSGLGTGYNELGMHNKA